MCVGNSGQLSITFLPSMEACIIKWLTPQSPDVGVQVQALPVALFPQTRNFIYSTLYLFTQVYQWKPATYCWG